MQNSRGQGCGPHLAAAGACPPSPACLATLPRPSCPFCLDLRSAVNACVGVSGCVFRDVNQLAGHIIGGLLLLCLISSYLSQAPPRPTLPPPQHMPGGRCMLRCSRPYAPAADCLRHRLHCLPTHPPAHPASPQPAARLPRWPARHEPTVPWLRCVCWISAHGRRCKLQQNSAAT